MDLNALVFEVGKAVAGVTVLMVGWLLVQLAWRRTFPEQVGADGDVLASRGSCHGCEKEGSCDTASRHDHAH